MTVFLDKKRWTEVFSGFVISSVALLDRRALHFCARQRMSIEESSHLFDHDIATRLIVLYTDREAGSNCGFRQLTGMAHSVVGVSRPPFPRPSGMVCAMNMDGDVYPRGGGVEGPMEHIDPGKWPSTLRLKCIRGYTFAVGVGRGVYKRVDAGTWLAVDAGLPRPDEVTTRMGFEDIDAFSESDMYAVGGHGDVWHFDGQAWKQMGFPSNVQLATVTCAGDGNVYISGEGGSLWVGQKSTWKSVYRGTSTVPWNDVRWFQDKLWLASNYQFYQWDGSAMARASHEGEAVPMYGHMDVHDGLLVIASQDSVRTFDGAAWRHLVEPYDE